MSAPVLHALQIHPATSCASVSALRAGVEVSGDALALCFVIEGMFEGRSDAVRIPAQGPAAGQAGFDDGLWRHTCLEAFVGTRDGTAYREFNFAPDGRWAAYAFTDYRQRDPQWMPSTAPGIECSLRPHELILHARVPLALLPAWSQLVTGLTAVIETRDGALSYWALAHPGERPDFHLREAFHLGLDLHRDHHD